MTKFARLFLATFLITSLSNFTSRAMEESEKGNSEIQETWNNNDCVSFTNEDGVEISIEATIDPNELENKALWPELSQDGKHIRVFNTDGVVIFDSSIMDEDCSN